MHQRMFAVAALLGIVELVLKVHLKEKWLNKLWTIPAEECDVA